MLHFQVFQCSDFDSSEDRESVGNEQDLGKNFNLFLKRPKFINRPKLLVDTDRANDRSLKREITCKQAGH